MLRGLVIGKFMPFHNGHVELINFAQANCDELIVLVCAENDEPIKGEIRQQWLQQYYNTPNVIVQLLKYSDNILPNTSVSSKVVSKLWADFLLPILPDIDIVFSSEEYGNYLAGYMGCKHMLYDIDRVKVPVSATKIRSNPAMYAHYLPQIVLSYFVKKVCLYGSESTGKTTLAEKLANHYNTTWVPEMARQIVEETEVCTEQNLIDIAVLHAKTIIEKIAQANAVLFVDTDLNITKSYSWFLFNKVLEVPQWVEDANEFDLYLYLDVDFPFVQDGTRLDEERRSLLHNSHMKQLSDHKIPYVLIKGNAEERFRDAKKAVDNLLREQM